MNYLIPCINLIILFLNNKHNNPDIKDITINIEAYDTKLPIGIKPNRYFAALVVDSG